jgi:hypothetical protein
MDRSEMVQSGTEFRVQSDPINYNTSIFLLSFPSYYIIFRNLIYVHTEYNITIIYVIIVIVKVNI